MSETVTLDNFTVRGLPDRGYTLTAENVSSFTDGAKELAYEYLIPFLFSSYRTSYKKGKDATDISIRTRALVNLTESDFDNKEEFDSFKKYMKKILEKIRNIEILDAIKDSNKLKPSKTIFGALATKKDPKTGKLIEDTDANVLVSRLEGKKISELTDAAALGGDYGGGKADEGMEFRGRLQQLADREQSNPEEIFDLGIIRTPDDKKVYKYITFKRTGDSATFTLNVEDFYKDTFEKMGMDLDENFTKTGPQDDTRYAGFNLKVDLEEHLQPRRDRKTTLVTKFITNYKTNRGITVGDTDANGNWSHAGINLDEKAKEARNELLNPKHIGDIASLIIEGDRSFFTPIGDDFRININDVVLTVDFEGVSPKIKIENEKGKDDVKLLSKKQFLQTGVGGSMKSLAVIGRLNQKLEYLENKIARL